MGEEIIAAAAPAVSEIITEGVFAGASETDLTAVLDYLHILSETQSKILEVNTSIYAFVSYFVVIFFCAVILYFMLRPLFYFLR